MTFRKAVERAEIAHAFCEGLRALTKACKDHITVESRITGSVHLDEALARSHPNDPRWDYGVGVEVNQGKDKAVWIEIHPATSREVALVIRKFDWLQAWLKDDARDLKKMSGPFVWIASGKSDIPATSPDRKRLAMKGIQFAGGHFSV